VAAPETRKTLLLLAGDVVDRQRRRGGRHVDDHVDVVLVDTTAARCSSDVGLVLVVGRDDLDVDALGSAPKSSTAMRAAITEPSPLRSA
jgi:hypothetical protein